LVSKKTGKDKPVVKSHAAFNALNTNTIDRYQVAEKIGQGATGIVYLAKDPYIKRQVALKVSKPAPITKDKTISKYRERFFSEAQSAGGLSHPNIVSIYDVGIHKDDCYIAMEYVEGYTLEDVCEKDTLLPRCQTLIDYHLTEFSPSS